MDPKTNGRAQDGVPGAVDMREHRELIAQLMSAEERGALLTTIMDACNDALVSTDLRGIVCSWNLSAQRMFGYTAREMIGRSILELVPEDQRQREQEMLAGIQRDGQLDPFKTQRFTKHGQPIEVLLTVSPVRTQNGAICGLSQIARDLSEQIRSEAKNAMLSAIVESTDDAIISKDLGSIITSWNRSAERMFGYTAGEMIGRSILEIIPADRRQEEPMILGRLKNGEHVEHFETRRLTREGKLIDVSLTISPVRDGEGRIIGLSKIARDITEKKLEEQRKNDFIAIVSHELKTPLTSLRSYIQLALARTAVRADLATEKLLARAEAQTRKMSAMVHDFLNLSRLEEGKMELDRSIFPLAELMEEVVGEASILSPGYRFELECPHGPQTDADRNKIGQVMTNLVNNAVKYSTAGALVHISCRVVGDQVVIAVADQGIGISPDDQQRVFERFFRAGNDKTRYVSGFGIGLYLVSEILRLHGSSIALNSEPGKGSVFSFALPLYSGPAQGASLIS